MDNHPSNKLADRPTSRIENDVQAVKEMTVRLESITERIVMHARTLGYFEPASEAKQNPTPTPIISNLADSLRALDRALDHCSASLNVFD